MEHLPPGFVNFVKLRYKLRLTSPNFSNLLRNTIMVVLFTAALLVHIPSTATPHDLRDLVGRTFGGCPPVKTRRPTDIVATSVVDEPPSIHCFARLSTRSR